MNDDDLFKFLNIQIGEFYEDDAEEYDPGGKCGDPRSRSEMYRVSYRQYIGSSLEDKEKSVNLPKKFSASVDSFTAVDFETATADRMICQIGVVRVVNGVIKKRMVKLVRPPENRYDRATIRVHHITPEMTAQSPSFDQVWKGIKRYFINTVVVAHNSSFDEDALLKNLKKYNINEEGISPFICTYKLYGVGLVKLCFAFGMDTSGHHDALFDAMCCAQFYLNYLNGIKPDFSLLVESKTVTEEDIESSLDLLGYFTDDLIWSISPVSDFLDRKFLITGNTIFDREWAYQLIEKAGGKRLSSVSSRLAYAIIGRSPGPRKMEQLNLLRGEGHNINVMTDIEFLELMKSAINKEVK